LASLFYIEMVRAADATFDYHGALVVVETENNEIVLIHPLGGPDHSPASSKRRRVST
jgi:hypothetical protein